MVNEESDRGCSQDLSHSHPEATLPTVLQMPVACNEPIRAQPLIELTNQRSVCYRDDVGGVGPVHAVTVGHGREMLERDEEGERGGEVSRGHQQEEAERGVTVEAGVNHEAEDLIIAGLWRGRG